MAHSRINPNPLCHFGVLAGTTCATVLTRAILTEGCKSVAAGMNAMDLRRGISLAVDRVIELLKERSRRISTSEEIAQVGGGPTIERCGDERQDIIEAALTMPHQAILPATPSMCRYEVSGE